MKLLALEPGRRLHRDQAMEILWPELDAAKAQNNLHQAVHAARRVLGVDALTLADGMLGLATEAETDVDLFEAAARAADDAASLAAALDLFTGELLPEDRYEPWADARRTALTDTHSALCIELARRLDPDAAVAVLQRALAVDPLHEPAHRELMRTYHRLGRRQDALAQYHRLREALERALAADPDAETRALYRELLTREPDHEPRTASGLPAELTSFVGRSRELADVAERLGRARVLTLTGPGGSGKTRLAIAAAQRASMPGGVFFVELGGIADPRLVGDAAATAVGIGVPAKRTAAEAVAEHLAGSRALLVLDTCEHLLDGCAELVETVLASCPGVKILATSRERIRCGSETTWRVPGLTPDEALELFVSRARDAEPSFAPAGDELGEIEALCARLDGMPLALELAAARVGTFSPAQIAARLDDSLDVLTGGRRTALTRQQTLRATISWSHDLLTGEERVVLRRLSVFAGSYALDAAEDVCTGGAIRRHDIVDLHTRLVDKSLVVVEDSALARYRLLDTVRQFSAERLTASGERETVEARLRDWALAFVGEGQTLDRLELDHDNVRAALDSGLRHDPQGAMRLAESVWRFWLDRNYFTEGVRRLRAVLDAAPEATELRAETLLATAALELRCGELTAFVERGREAELLVQRGRPAFAGHVIHRAGLLYSAGATLDECAQACEEALARTDDPAVRASTLSASSLVPHYRGDFDDARRRLAGSLEALAAVPPGTPPFFEGVTFGLAILPEGPGGQLRPVFEESIFIFHRYDREQATAFSLCNLAMLDRVQDHPDEARAALGDALMRFRRLEDARGEAHALNALGNCARSFGEPDLGLVSFERSLDLRRRSGDRRAAGMTESNIALALAFTGDLAGAAAILAVTHDRFRAADDAPGQGGALLTWALAEERAGDTGRAAELYVEGADVWERHLAGPFPGWARLAAADALLAAGRDADARANLARAEHLLSISGETRGLALCREHRAAKSVQRSGKEPSS